MSWNGSVGPVLVSDLAAAMSEMVIYGPESPESAEQIAVAKHAALEIAQSGAVGSGSIPVYVNISGHANPAHADVTGMASDVITLNVTRYSPQYDRK